MLIGGCLERLKRRNLTFIVSIKQIYIAIFIVPNFKYGSLTFALVASFKACLLCLFRLWACFACLVACYCILWLKPDLGINSFFCCFVPITILNPQRALQQPINIQ